MHKTLKFTTQKHQTRYANQLEPKSIISIKIKQQNLTN